MDNNYRGQPKAGTGHKMLVVPFVYSKSRFQGPAFNKAIEGIPDNFGGTTTSTIFTRDYFMSGNLRVDI